jgi:predicted Rossmann fold flavoprotein
MRILVVGGGAAGFMAGITAAEQSPDNEVVIAEKSLHTLSKVLVSGGGRCNVTNQPTDIRAFAANYPRGERFLNKILHDFSPHDTVKWFEKRGVPLKVEADGRVFPESNKSLTIVECLIKRSTELGIRIEKKYSICNWEKDGDVFKVFDNQENCALFDRVVFAIGGQPKSHSFDIFKQHGLKVNSPVPSLFTFNSPNNPLCALQGISVPNARVKIIGNKLERTGPLLITHWGLSGPVILKLSAWGARILAELNYKFDISIHWDTNLKQEDLREKWLLYREQKLKSQVSNFSGIDLPARLWKFMVENAGIQLDLKWADISNKLIEKLIGQVTNQHHSIIGKTTFKEEFVTCGGIDVSEVNPLTMECNKIPGLYIIGELLDVDGITGGFNFQNAWTTGYIAGKHAGSLERV